MPSIPARQPAQPRLQRATAIAGRSLLSVGISACTAILIVACIHSGPGGIKGVQQIAAPPISRPTAALEFAPLTPAPRWPVVPVETGRTATF